MRPTEPARPSPEKPAGGLADRVVGETGPPPVLGKVGAMSLRVLNSSSPIFPPSVLSGASLSPVLSTNEDSSTRLIDAFGRRLTYLRVSVTDRCNLRCTYCLPADADFPFGDKAFLSPEEIEVLVGALVRLGIRRVRLTGGEPLVRKDILEIVRR